MCASRLDEIRKKLREEIKSETNKNSVSALKSSTLVAGTNLFRAPRQGMEAQTSRNFFRPTSSETEAGQGVQLSESAHKVAPRSECKALCIGMNKYIYLNELENATRDAQDMASVMNHLGYEVTSIFDRDSVATRKYLERFLSSIEAGDDVVLTFAGHGASFNSEAHLFPIDATQPHEAINLYSDFIDKLQFTNAKSAIVIIDACRNQERLDAAGLPNQDHLTDQVDWELLEDWFEKLNNPSNIVNAKHRARMKTSESSFGHGIIYATSHDTGASDGSDGIENGLFTHFFKQEILNPHNSLTEIFNNVRREVIENSQGRQRPSFHDELSERYYFYPR